MTRVTNSGSFELPLAAEEAFPLFTAEGESRWVPGWSPEILGALPQHPGLVFLTNAHGPATIWTVLESDAEALTHRYSRVTPGLIAGIVEVKLFSTSNGCKIRVSYNMTALSPEGELSLAAYRGAAFTAMLREWRELIIAAIGADQLQPA